jgi:hypothetical protein
VKKRRRGLDLLSFSLSFSSFLSPSQRPGVLSPLLSFIHSYGKVEVQASMTLEAGGKRQAIAKEGAVHWAEAGCLWCQENQLWDP